MANPSTYAARVDHQIEVLGRRLERLEERVQEYQRQAEKRARDFVQGLEAREVEFRERLEGFLQASELAWRQTMNAMEVATDKLESTSRGLGLRGFGARARKLLGGRRPRRAARGRRAPPVRRKAQAIGPRGTAKSPVSGGSSA